MTDSPSSAETTSSAAEALLAAHVEHELARFTRHALGGLIEESIAALFRWFAGVKCREVFSPHQIAEIIERNVIELKVSGGITELAGEMSRAVFSSSTVAETLVEDICAPEAYAEFADQIMALDGVRRELIRYVTQSSGFRRLSGRVLTSVVLSAVAEAASRAPLARELIARFERELAPGLEARVSPVMSRLSERWAAYAVRHAEQGLIEAFDAETLRDIADELWDTLATKPLSEATLGFSVQDLEDFVVLGYEFWLKFRKTPYFRAVTREVIERLFAKYGDDSVASLIADMGVTEEMVCQELRAVLAPIVERAMETGFLEQQIRSRLEPFYRSAAAKAILER